MGAPHPLPPVVLSREDVEPMPTGATAVSPVKPSTTNSPLHALYLHPAHPQKHVHGNYTRKLTDDSGPTAPSGRLQAIVVAVCVHVAHTGGEENMSSVHAGVRRPAHCTHRSKSMAVTRRLSRGAAGFTGPPMWPKVAPLAPGSPSSPPSPSPPPLAARSSLRRACASLSMGNTWQQAKAHAQHTLTVTRRTQRCGRGA
jgi:hypothetical protein